MTSLLKVAVLLSSVLLSGCSSLMTAYVRPDLPRAPKWETTGGSSQPDAATNWWQSFGDKNLNTLVTSVLANNNDVIIASIRVRQAMIAAERAGVAMFPTLSGSGSGQREIVLTDSTYMDTFRYSLGASYEVDLWGRLSSEKDVARIKAVAAAEDMAAARVTVIATTIETYWRLAFANQDLAAAEDGLAAATRTEELVRDQISAGAATDLELAEVRQTVESQAAAIADLKQTRVTLRNTLGVLLNGAANPVAEPHRLPGRTPVVLSAGLPASLLSRRPDLRAAEWRLQSTLRTVDGTRASLYPQITLTGSLGSTSNELATLLSNPLAVLGVGITLPFLNFADGKLRVTASEADYELAVAEFRTTLLNAFSDTANALSARKFLNEKARRLRAALEAATTAEKLTGERYRAGTVALRVWLDAQEKSRTAARAAIAVRLEQLIAEVQVFRVLGGPPSKL